MIGTACPDDFLMTCGSGGSWWPLIVGVVVLGWLVRRGWPS